MRPLLLACLLVLTTPPGTARAAQEAIPAAISALAKRLQEAPRANPPARITRYRWHERTVYFVPQRCCDIPSMLYDEGGAVICLPDGGIHGRGDGKCADFFDTRSDEHLIWADARKPPQRK